MYSTLPNCPTNLAEVAQNLSSSNFTVSIQYCITILYIVVKIQKDIGVVSVTELFKRPAFYDVRVVLPPRVTSAFYECVLYVSEENGA